MGYPVYYDGEISITPALKPEDHDVLLQIIDDTPAPAGQEAERIYKEMTGEFNLEFSCPLTLTEDGLCLAADSEEQRPGIEDWLRSLSKHFFKPRGYSLEGEVSYSGDNEGDCGVVYVKDGKVEGIDDVCYNNGPSWALNAYMSEPVKIAAERVVDSADDTGCDGDLTVCSKSAVAELGSILKQNRPEENSAVASEGGDTSVDRPDNELSPSQLADKYNEWGDHPVYGAADWRQEVAEAVTRRGYWEWVASRLEENN